MSGDAKCAPRFCRNDKFESQFMLLSLQFPAMRIVSIQNSDAFVLVYDLTREETFDECSRLREEIHNVKSSSAPIVVVGNKLDKTGELSEVCVRNF